MSISLSTLSDNAIEESTYIIIVTFTDEDDVATIPATLTWTLSDVNNAVINSREDVSVAVPAAVTNILLSGDDLAITGSKPSAVRVFTVEGTYDSSLQAGVPFKESVRFNIKNLSAVIRR